MELKNYTLNELISLRSAISSARYSSLVRSALLGKNNPNREKARIFYQERVEEHVDLLMTIKIKDPDSLKRKKTKEALVGFLNTLEANSQYLEGLLA